MTPRALSKPPEPPSDRDLAQIVLPKPLGLELGFEVSNGLVFRVQVSGARMKSRTPWDLGFRPAKYPKGPSSPYLWF